MSFKSALLVCVVAVAILVSLTTAKKGKKKGKSEPPKWKTHSMPNLQETHVEVMEDETMSLDCSAKGRPRPKIKWMYNGEEIDTDLETQYKLKKHILTVDKPKYSDSGNYTCALHNKFGNLQWSFNVTIHTTIWPLEIESIPNITANIGDTVTFSCKVKNDPNATYKWLKRHEPPQQESGTNAKTEFVSGGSDPKQLVLSDITEKDNGEYRCLVGNRWGVMFQTAYLNVLPPPTTRPPTTTTTARATTTTTTRATTTTTTTTRRMITEQMVTFFPVHRRNKDKDRKRKNKNRNKNRKNNKKNMTKAPITYYETSTKFMFPSRDIDREMEHSTFNYNGYQPNNELPETKIEYKPDPIQPEEEVFEEGRAQETASSEDYETISLWTIYTIVGSISGIILLLGLVAMTVALCCRRDGRGGYKSTPV